ncbi:MAG: hypothetical protein JXK16_06325 [Thiotrichales bacterium]|nr:hypothetical protein [Thiotrichales bacterium]
MKEQNVQEVKAQEEGATNVEAAEATTEKQKMSIEYMLLIGGITIIAIFAVLANCYNKN